MLKIKRKKDQLAKTPTGKLYQQFFTKEKVKLNVLYPFLSADQINGKIKKRWQTLQKDNTASSPLELFTPTKWKSRNSSPRVEKKTGKHCSSKFVWETPELTNEENDKDLKQCPDEINENQSSPSTTTLKTYSKKEDKPRSSPNTDINLTKTVICEGSENSDLDGYDYADSIDDDAVLIRRKYDMNDSISDSVLNGENNDSQSSLLDSNNNFKPKSQPQHNLKTGKETSEDDSNESKTTSESKSDHTAKSSKDSNENHANYVGSKRLRKKLKSQDKNAGTHSNENYFQSKIEEKENLKVKSPQKRFQSDFSIDLSPNISPVGRTTRSKSSKYSMLSPNPECNEGKSAKSNTKKKLKLGKVQESNENLGSHSLTRPNSKRVKDHNNNICLSEGNSVSNETDAKKVSKKDKKNGNNFKSKDEDKEDDNVITTLSDRVQSTSFRVIHRAMNSDTELGATASISQKDGSNTVQKMTPSGDATSTYRNLKRKFDEVHDSDENSKIESDKPTTDDNDEIIKTSHSDDDDDYKSHSQSSSESDVKPCSTDSEDIDEPIVKRTVSQNSTLERILNNLRSTGRKSLSVSDHEPTSQSSILSGLSDENLDDDNDNDDDVNVNDMFSDVVTPDEQCKEPYKTTRMVKQSAHNKEEEMNQQFEQLFQVDDMIFL